MARFAAVALAACCLAYLAFTQAHADVTIERMQASYVLPPQGPFRERTTEGGVYMTLTTNSKFALGALVMAYSLIRTNTSHQIVCLVTPSVSKQEQELMRQVFDQVIEVEPLQSSEKTTQSDSWVKLRAWERVEFAHVVYLGADTLVLRPVDELFGCPAPCGVLDSFLWEVTEYGPTVNGDVLVLDPSLEDFAAMADGTKVEGYITRLGPYDQALINKYFKWRITALPFFYNFMPYLVVPKEKLGREWMWQPDRVKIVHYAIHKPWSVPPEPFLDEVGMFDAWRQTMAEMVSRWPSLAHFVNAAR
eukprot:tig00020830_g14398.t1